MNALSERKLIKWWADSESECVGQYRRDGTGAHFKRARILVNGRAGGFYGIGLTFEEADAALRTFTNPKCICFPGEPNVCEIHPGVRTHEHKQHSEGLALECYFTEFERDYERWPNSGYKEDGAMDEELITKWGHRT